MTVQTYYVGAGGNDGDALTWANRKSTLTKAEDIPVAAGDTVYVGPGTYREKLTVDVSGGAGTPITYIGDYDGSHTDGVGGVVRLTGSADDVALTQTSCVTAASKNYRTFQGFRFDGASAVLVDLATSCGNWIIDKCFLEAHGTTGISLGGTGTNNTVKNCYILPHSNSQAIYMTHSSTVDNAAHLIQNCIIIGGTTGINSAKVGGVTIKNCTIIGTGGAAIRVVTALAAGQTVVANNCVIHGCNVGFQATAVGEIIENYNNLSAVKTARTNTDTGANSTVNLTLFDSRWFFETTK